MRRSLVSVAQAVLPMRIRSCLTSPVTPQAASGSGTDRLVSGEAVEFDIRIARLGSRTLALMIDIMVQIGLLMLLYTALAIGLGIVGQLADAALAVAGTVVISAAVL